MKKKSISHTGAFAVCHAWDVSDRIWSSAWTILTRVPNRCLMFEKWDSIAFFSAALFPNTFIIIGFSICSQFSTKLHDEPIISMTRSASSSDTGLFSRSKSSSWPTGSSIRTNFSRKWKSKVNNRRQASKMLHPLMLGSWQTSPLAIISVPPNDSSFPFKLRIIISIAANVSPDSKLISSMNNAWRLWSNVFRLWSKLSRVKASCASDSAEAFRTFSLNNLCMCSP